jgi:hypothetical protein
VADKTTCPGCESYTSGVLAAFRNGEPCPYCGLAAEDAGWSERRCSHCGFYGWMPGPVEAEHAAQG